MVLFHQCVQGSQSNMDMTMIAMTVTLIVGVLIAAVATLIMLVVNSVVEVVTLVVEDVTSIVEVATLLVMFVTSIMILSTGALLVVEVLEVAGVVADFGIDLPLLVGEEAGLLLEEDLVDQDMMLLSPFVEKVLEETIQM